MSNMSIGISGLKVAQQAMEIIGNNIANASSEGYHSQDVRISPRLIGGVEYSTAAAGAEITEIRRNVNELLEKEITRQNPLLGQIEQELLILKTIESNLGELSNEGLGSAIKKFFNSLRQLAAQPDSLPMREQVIWAGQDLADQFRAGADFLSKLDQHVKLHAAEVVSRINDLSSEVAALNAEIEAFENRSGSSNVLVDRRDQAINELARLADIRILKHPGNTGEVDVTAWGNQLVIGSQPCELEIGVGESGLLGVGAKDSGVYQTDAAGGEVGALLNLTNNIIKGLKDDLDTLAEQIIAQVNRYHVQGLGSGGSFEQLTGQRVDAGTISSWNAGVSAGDLHVRIIDESTGNVVREKISVDPSADTLVDIASRLDALDHISASVVDSALHIQADSGYQFDFLPALMPQPAASTLTGTAEPIVSGLYSGSSNQTFTCMVVGSGQVGVTDGLALQVRNGDGELVKTLNLGSGYAAGDRLTIDDGIELAFSHGTLNDGETFTIEALAESDPTGLLAVLGLNTFFLGNSAETIRLSEPVMEDPRKLATSLGDRAGDGNNAGRMAELDETILPGLGNLSFTDYHRNILIDIGQKVSSRQARYDALQNVRQQLINQRDEVSGVDVNEQAAKLIVFEKMFQAMSKVISVQRQMLDHLMQII